MFEERTSPRIQFIDLAKGICIILVVLLHCSVELNVQLRHVRMPLYFVLSGLFYKSYGCYLDFLVKKFNKLLVPFCCFLFAGILLQFSLLVLSNFQSGVYLFEGVNNVRVIQGWLTPGDMVNNPIWFLLSLFFCNMFFFIISENLGKKYMFGAVLLLTTLGFYCVTIKAYIPFYIVQSLVAMPFFYLGSLLKKTGILLPSKYDKIATVCAIIIFILSCIWANNAGISFIFYDNQLGDANMFLFYTVSTVSVVSLLLICKAIKTLPLISYLGKYSIVVLCVHQLIIEVILLVLYKFPSMLSKFVDNNPIVLFLIVMLLSLSVIPILTRYMPTIIAQKDMLKLKNNR